MRVGVNASAMHSAITYRESFLDKNSRSFRAIHSLLSVSGKRKKLLWPVAWRSDCGELDGDAWDAGLTRILQEVYSCLLDA